MRRSIGPAAFMGGMPHRTAAECFDFPYAVHAHIGISIQSPLPPLPRHPGGSWIPLIMSPSHHHTAEPCFGWLSVGRNVNHILHHRMIKKKTEPRTVLTSGETSSESIAISAANAGLASKNSAEKIKLAIFCMAVHHFILHALVEKVTIQMVQGTRWKIVPTYVWAHGLNPPIAE